MASRLSEEALKEVYDRGVRGLSWSAVAGDGDLLVDPIDFSAILEHEDADERVKALHPYALFCAIKMQGIEDLIEVLPLLSGEQVTRILDYEAWTGDRIEPLKAMTWLKLFKEVSNEQFFGRFKDLEEEYQLALLGSRIELIQIEDHEKLGSAEQDTYSNLPCGELFYRVVAVEPGFAEFVESLVQAGLETDLRYTYSLLTHVAFMPPAEDEFRIAQFRRARLEEEGFADPVEAMTIFRPLSTVEVRDLAAMVDGVRQDSLNQRVDPSEGLLATTEDESTDLLDRALQHGSARWTEATLDEVSRGLAHFANRLAAAVGIQPDEIKMLSQVVTLSRATLSLGLDSLATGDVEMAGRVIGRVHPELVFRHGLALVGELRRHVVEQLVATGMRGCEGAERLLQTGRLGELMYLFDKQILPILGLDVAETLKGIFNRFPMVVKHSVNGERLTLVPMSSMRMLKSARGEVDGIVEQILALRNRMMSTGNEDWQVGAAPVDH